MQSRALGAYQLDERIGRSMLGTTYLGLRKESKVAIKVLEIAGEIGERERRAVMQEFQQRAQAISSLFHPGILPLRDYGVATPFLYAVSGYQPAKSLADQQQLGTITLPLPHAVVVAWLGQLAEALSEAHRSGVAHGNLKPSNIFIGEQGGDVVRLIIGDFALVSRRTDALIAGPGARPLWRYQAPDLRRSDEPDRKMDEFALAAIVYEWLTGQPPFGDNAPELRPPAPTAVSTLNPALAAYAELDAIFSRALSAQPDNRYASVGAFTRDLLAVLEAQSGPEEESGPRPVADQYSTRPAISDGASAVAAPRPDNPPPPVVQQQNPSAWLVEGPSTGTMPGPPPPLAMMTSEELYQVPPPARRRVKKRMSLRRYPGESDSNEKPKVSTREQELIAPPAARNPGPAYQRAAPVPSQLPPLASRRSSSPFAAPASSSMSPPSVPFDRQRTFRDDISRRDLLKRAGQGAIIAGLGVAAIVGAKIAWDRVSGAIGGQHRQLPAQITLPTPFNLTGHSGSVQALDWGAGTTRLASGAANDGAIRVWDMHNPQQPSATLSAPDATHGITALSWGRDGRTLFAAVAQANAEIWDIRQQTPIGHVPYPVEVGQWQPAQDILALVSWASQAPEAAGGQAVIVWDIASAKTITSLKGLTDKIQALAWSPIGPGLMLAAGGRDNTIFVWSGKDAASMAPINTGLKGHSAPITAISWSSQDLRVVSGSADGTARVWDVNQPGNSILLQQDSGAIGAVAWSPIYPLVAVGNAGGTITLWDVETRRRLSQVAAGSGAILSLAWSSDGHYLAAGSDNHTVYVWDTSHF